MKPGQAAARRAPDDAEEFGILPEPAANGIPQSESLQADGAVVTQKIVEMRQHRAAGGSSRLQAAQGAEAAEELHEAADEVADAAPAAGRPRMKRPVLRDPGPARPMAGFTLKYFDSFEYQTSAAGAGAAAAAGGAADGARAAAAPDDEDAELLDGYVDVKREAEAEAYGAAPPAPQQQQQQPEEGASQGGGAEAGECEDDVGSDDGTGDAAGASIGGRNLRYINIEQETRRALHTVSANAIASRGLEQQFTLQYDRLASPSRHGTLGASGVAAHALGDFDIGEISKGSIGRRTMTPHNVSHEGGRFSVILPRLPLRAVYNPGIVAAGLAVPITMELDTAELPLNSFYHQVVIIKTEMHVFNVNVVADVVEKPNRKFAAATKQHALATAQSAGGAQQRQRAAQERLSGRGAQLRPLGTAASDAADARGATLDPNRTLKEVLATSSRQ